MELMGKQGSLSRTRWAAVSAIVFLLACAVFLAGIYFGPVQQAEGIEVAFVLAIMLSITAFALFATARLGFSLMLSGLLFIALSGVAFLKQEYLGNALLISDVYYMTGTSVMKTVAEYPKLWKVVVSYLLLSAGLLFAAWRFSWRPFSKARWMHRLQVRLAACLLAAGAAFWVLWPQGPFASLHARSLWTVMAQEARLTGFFLSINTLKVVLPDVHNTPEQNALWDERASEAVQPRNPVRPDIVMVLEESTFDPSTLPICDIPQCRNHSLFEPSAYTRAHGPMFSYVYGAGTWLSEFSALTGLPHPVFGSAGGYAPWLLAPRMRDSLPLQLHRLGYRNIAVYPVDGGYLNARDAYSHYGFDAFHDALELGLAPWAASDQSIFEAAERVYGREREKSGQPIFLMILTMNQHGPHDNHPLESLPEPYRRGLFPHLPAETQLDLSNYLSRLDASDRAMEGLQKFILERRQPSIVMNFGDHKPSFSGVMAQLKISAPVGFEGDPQHLTYFKLDANFQTPPLPHYPVMDIAYLPGLLLQAADLPTDKYFAATQYLREKCNGMFAYCDDKQTLYGYYAWLFSDNKVFQ